MDLMKELNAAITQEEIVAGNGTSTSDLCPRQSSHVSFIPISELNFNSFPQLYQNNQILKLIQKMARLTVRISYRCLEEPDKECRGSGFIQRIRKVNNDKCPCLERAYKTNDKSKKWYELTITTTRPVFSHYKSGTEVLADLFYDNDQDMGKQVVRIFENKFEDPNGDENDWGVCYAATHCDILAEELSKNLEDFETLQGTLYQRYKNESSNLVVIVGHPHGGPKMVSIGEKLQRMIIKEDRSGKVLCRYAYDAVTCPGCSGSPVFISGQPISGFGYWFGHPHNHLKGPPMTSGHSDNHYSFSSVGMDQCG